ncbi:MAG: hypothetical protein OH319_03400 [Candidatus Parvarchaeota archaeon]|nr:hypothetical protein [Candidatus Jingweiarchaeum tengchongense]MCW1298539.1 hypothetical protein [Candidatus Jingweiarchaeum tengchongense]MCW1300215.1 hypothetical protein [Candidatus Jingweiarchaeum tengchongense]MCW1304551.1 hypothetical protein [Candidatus Jingweiarchaeum tengchongense]MCW1305721.1 hypothetical protein [Candidatus Jingweiarchaeum tengchongense]
MGLEDILNKKLPIFCKFLQEEIYKDQFRIDTIRFIGQVICRNGLVINEIELKSREGERRIEYFSINEDGKIVYHKNFGDIVAKFDKKIMEYVS